MKILNLCNSISAYKTLKETFGNNSRDEYCYGKEEEFNFQVSKENLDVNSIIPNIDDFDKIRIWYTKRNINECIFASFLVDAILDRSKIELINIDSWTSYYQRKPIIHLFFSSGEIASSQFKKLYKKNTKTVVDEVFFLDSVKSEFEKSKLVNDALLIIDSKFNLKFFRYDEFKEYILAAAKDWTEIPHILADIMDFGSMSFEYYFEDHVIYKFVLDLINEGKLEILSNFYMNFSRPIKVRAKNI